MLLSEIAWLVFIRAGSTRFPRKCYEKISGKNIFDWLSVHSLSVGIRARDLYLCTSNNPENEEIARQANALGHSVLVGSEEFPIKRIIDNWDSIKDYKYFVRICGDSPLYPFGTVMNAISAYEGHDPSAITNTRDRIFPPGFSIEVYRTLEFAKAISENKNHSLEEHMCRLLEAGTVLGQNTIDIKTDDDLSFFELSRYTVDFVDDIDTIEQCIRNGHAKKCKLRLEDVQFI